MSCYNLLWCLPWISTGYLDSQDLICNLSAASMTRYPSAPCQHQSILIVREVPRPALTISDVTVAFLKRWCHTDMVKLWEGGFWGTVNILKSYNWLSRRIPAFSPVPSLNSCQDSRGCPGACTNHGSICKWITGLKLLCTQHYPYISGLHPVYYLLCDAVHALMK